MSSRARPPGGSGAARQRRGLFWFMAVQPWAGLQPHGVPDGATQAEALAAGGAAVPDVVAQQQGAGLGEVEAGGRGGVGLDAVARRSGACRPSAGGGGGRRPAL
jgi:hypothetical protein